MKSGRLSWSGVMLTEMSSGTGAGLFQPLKIPAGLLDEQKAQLVEEMILPRQRDHQGRVKEAGGWMLPP